MEAVYYNLVRASLELGHRDEAHRFYRDALPLVESNPDREAARFNFLKGRLLASADPPDFANALPYYEKSIQADEASGAVVPAAQTRYYLAQMLLQSGDTERSLSIFENIKDKFGKWNIPYWHEKCAQQLRLFD